MSFFRRLKPATLAARIFWGVAAASLISAVAIWGWLYTRFYESLDREASLRMKQTAESLLFEVRRVQSAENDHALRRALIGHFWGLEASAGMIQNLYWLDLSGPRPSFIASFSNSSVGASSMLPPTSEEAEDLIYDFINDLDRGAMVFPDPYSLGEERRFKIVLCPVLDANGLLESVIGIESDMEYLRLAYDFRRLLAEGIGLAVIVSLLVSLLLARNVSAKIGVFRDGVIRISAGKQPEELRLSIRELDDLYQAFIRMAADLEQQKTHVQKVFSRKLDELAFTGGAIAHEIRNPLSAIEMHFGLLKREIARVGAATGESPAIQEIEQQLGHLRRLLTSFLDYSRKVRPQCEKVGLSEFFQRILDGRRQVLGDFAFTLEIPESLTGIFDPSMLQQVIENLVNNAFQAAAEGNLHLTLRAVTDGSLLRLKVADNGPGVPAAIAEQLFTPFVSGSAGGNGFGLAISRKLVEAHGGEIYHEKNPDSGAVFIIEVPQHENTRS